jgi:acetyl-CoA carboxylase carboxyl transferase subunit beta
MQEGMWSLVQMAKTVEARRRHTTAGLLHITLLTSPTTGGVYASFASLADVVYAETEATVGFAGPRVVEQVTGDVSEPDAHTAEAAYAHGLIDAIVARDDQRKTIIRALKALAKKRDFYHHPDTPVMAGLSQPLAAWDALQRVRAPAWPKADDILDVLLTDAIEFRGDRTGASDDEHVVTRAGPLAATQHSVVAIGQNAVGDGRIRPAGFRKAVRAIEIAGRLGLPVVTVIDTRGADPTASSEGAGVAVAIARTFDAMLACPTPTVAVLTGEGGSGGALAMASADHVLAFEKSLFSVIAPEGAATILYRDASRAPELAERLRMTVPHLLELGLVNATIPEPEGGVTGNPLIAMQILASAVGGEVERLAAMPQRRRLRLRARRWRDVAKPSVRRRRGR